MAAVVHCASFSFQVTWFHSELLGSAMRASLLTMQMDDRLHMCDETLRALLFAYVNQKLYTIVP